MTSNVISHKIFFKKLNKKFTKIYTSHGEFSYDFTCIIKCKTNSHDFHMN